MTQLNIQQILDEQKVISKIERYFSAYGPKEKITIDNYQDVLEDDLMKELFLTYYGLKLKHNSITGMVDMSKPLPNQTNNLSNFTKTLLLQLFFSKFDDITDDNIDYFYGYLGYDLELASELEKSIPNTSILKEILEETNNKIYPE